MKVILLIYIYFPVSQILIVNTIRITISILRSTSITVHLGLYIETVISLPALQPVHPNVTEHHGERPGDLIAEGFFLRSINIHQRSLCVHIWRNYLACPGGPHSHQGQGLIVGPVLKLLSHGTILVLNENIARTWSNEIFFIFRYSWGSNLLYLIEDSLDFDFLISLNLEISNFLPISSILAANTLHIRNSLNFFPILS